MDIASVKKLGTCLSRDYAEDLLRLLVNYQDISASEAASRLNLHIRTAQDFMETLAELGILAKKEVSERKRPYFRYSLLEEKISLEIDLGLLSSHHLTDADLDRQVREKKGSGAQFSTARSGNKIASITTWTGNSRQRKERKINLTSQQGRFLYHLPFPTAEFLPMDVIMHKAGVSDEHKGEILDLVAVLKEHGVIEIKKNEGT